MNRHTLLRYTGFIVLIGLLTAWVFFSQAKNPPDPRATARVELGDIEDVVLADAKLEPGNITLATASATGRLESLNVKVGDHVTAGELIAQVDSTAARGDLLKATDELEQQRIEQHTATGKLRKSELNLKRLNELRQHDAASSKEYEDAQQDVTADRAALQKIDIQFRRATAEQTAAEKKLSETKVAAPCDGEVIQVVAHVGQLIGTTNNETSTIAYIAQPDRMVVKASISESDISRLKHGQKAYVMLLGSSEQRFWGTVETIASAPDNYDPGKKGDDAKGGGRSASYTVTFAVPNATHHLRTGMTAQAGIVTAAAQRVALIPAAALRQKNEDNSYDVDVCAPGGGVETRRVQIGINDNVKAQVISGLKEGELICLNHMRIPSDDTQFK